ncbi:MAG TPA: hypothetical protein VJH37_04370 [Candidatus Nanoarchaeia archaeon]|nr:hypothetical protein [Candidatus Nanoarchaeia archaeon]
MRITQDMVYQALDGRWRTESEIRIRTFRFLDIPLPPPQNFFAAQGRAIQRAKIRSHLVSLVSEGYADYRCHEELVAGRWVQKAQYRDPNMVEKTL